MDIHIRLYTVVDGWRWGGVVYDGQTGAHTHVSDLGGAFESADAPCWEAEMDYAVDQVAQQASYQLRALYRKRQQ